ncbi:hypothetical protein PABG_06367 [Paracoccidioides brasiliensis Pb03]|nr:hypothetical protein PABG_06367 [Paracoccidioides brasiliensis Pb03]
MNSLRSTAMLKDAMNQSLSALPLTLVFDSATGRLSGSKGKSLTAPQQSASGAIMHHNAAGIRDPRNVARPIGQTQNHCRMGSMAYKSSGLLSVNWDRESREEALQEMETRKTKILSNPGVMPQVFVVQ